MRQAQQKRFLMCEPRFFTVEYRINPWMDPTHPTSTSTAVEQWRALKASYEAHGHVVETVEPVEGLPDMVFAANGGLVVDGRAMGARFLYPQRTGEEVPYEDTFRRLGAAEVVHPVANNEGEGDFLVGDALPGQPFFAGTGFRTDPAAHAEVAEFFGREVVTMDLVDPRYYHLDTAMAVLTPDTVMVLPGAFSEAGRKELASRFDTVIEASDEDGAVLGLNAVSDGLHVWLEAAATGLHAQLREHGFEPIGVDMSELRLSGGSVKCCTLELRGLS